MKKKWILKIGLIIAVFVGVYSGRQWYILSRVTRSPEAAWRAAVVPSELDLSDVDGQAGRAVNLGFAQFMLPVSGSVQLRCLVDEMAVKGHAGTVEFVVLPPFNPALTGMKNERFEIDLETLSETLPKHSSSPGLSFESFLDLEIDLERTLPQPFWKSLFMRPAAFNMYAARLLTKSMKTSLGMHSVHTFETESTRGLVLIGQTRKDQLRAHISFADRSGNQAAGMHIHTTGEDGVTMVDILPLIVKTFRFTQENLPTEAQIKAFISGAGIPMETKSPTID